jgi:hypothetical protein
MSIHRNAQMQQSSMIEFLTCFVIFQGWLSVDIAAYCTPCVCSFTHAWFHKRCAIRDLPFGYLKMLILIMFTYSLPLCRVFCFPNLFLMNNLLPYMLLIDGAEIWLR